MLRWGVYRRTFRWRNDAANNMKNDKNYENPLNPLLSKSGNGASPSELANEGVSELTEKILPQAVTNLGKGKGRVTDIVVLTQYAWTGIGMMGIIIGTAAFIHHLFEKRKINKAKQQQIAAREAAAEDKSQDKKPNLV
eukprot:TRINITY_DN3141_c0_g1_i1.p1 TRINITY_DN3141_c0_g1~~TRINITY_DN3141_c0_g1_i1.p1  ORF type:complete len:138 (-),score=40.75 TRINITY_DN3141_c0_g1_i1:16-429(-)